MKIIKRAVVYIFIGAILHSCDDSNIIGLEIQPEGDKITIKNDSITYFNIRSFSEDSLRSDESLNLLLGQSNDPIFGENRGAFITQILLPYNNIEQINNVIIDSVVLSYVYSGYYGNLNLNNDFNVNVYELGTNIYKDSAYYSNFSPNYFGDNLCVSNKIISDTSDPMLNLKLDNSFGEKIINQTGTGSMVDNQSFVDFFKGFYIEASASNTIIYLNALSSKSRLSIYYHEIGVDTAISLDFSVGSEAARINLFNKKDSSNVIGGYLSNQTYLQSMSGHKAEFTFENINALKELFSNKAINQTIINFEIIEDVDFAAHEKLYLVRETNDGDIVFLTDFTIEGDEHFGGGLNNKIYSFNISRYFFQLINNPEYTNKLYLLSSGSAANANRTILDNSKITINIIYSDL